MTFINKLNLVAYKMFMKLYLLLYADDIVIFSESNDFQLALNGMSDYCSLWNLKVNVLKTKVIIFSRGNLKNKPLFFLSRYTC